MLKNIFEYIKVYNVSKNYTLMPEGYVGVKFKTEMIGNDLPNEDFRLERLKFWCGVFHERELAPPYECGGGSYGNLSFRLKDGENGFVITASQSGLEESTTTDRFVIVPEVDLRKGIVYAKGLRKPSSESMVHYAIYERRPEIWAVFHGHCAKITQDAERLGIPITSKEEKYGTIELVERVQEVLDGLCFLEMRNHGFLALGKTLDEAGEIALRFLETTRASA